MNNIEYFKTLFTEKPYVDENNVVSVYLADLEHNYLTFSNKSVSGMISLVTITLIRHYLHNLPQPINRWKIDNRPFYIDVISKETVGFSNEIIERKYRSKPFNYIVFAKKIREHGFFETKWFDLPPLTTSWLEFGGVASRFDNSRPDNVLAFGLMSGNLEQSFNNNFPIKPIIYNEGLLVDNCLAPLIQRIIKKRIDLVESSKDAVKIDWFFSLKDLINDLISSIDITLILIYLKAQYDPLPGWTFDLKKLGNRNGVRIQDKLKWVYQITGNQLNIEKEKPSLIYLKDIRNHLNHFDPPCVAFTVEEIADILNKVIDIGLIHLKIREALKVNPSELLINFILQPEVVYTTKNTTNKKKVNNLKEGYKTSTWPN